MTLDLTNPDSALRPSATEKPVIAKSASTSAHLVSGGVAGLVSAVMLQPLDLLKTRLQQQPKENQKYRPTMVKELRKLASIKDLWRGVLPSTLRTSVGSGLYLSILSRSRQYLALTKATVDNSSAVSALPKLSHAENLASGFVARALVGLITMPITVVKTRVESSVYKYNSIYETVRGIYRNGSTSAGSVRHFFRGTVATLARDSPYAGIYMLFYEGFKNEVFQVVLRPLIADEALFAGASNSAAAVSAACIATIITTPFDAIKTRLQLAKSTGTASTATVIRQLVRELGGAWNLFNGLSLRVGPKALSAAISWCIYEELLKF